MNTGNDFKLRNMMEELVQKHLISVMVQSQCCTCPICQLDVMAIALNKLPPSYVVSSAGEALARVHREFSSSPDSDIILAIAQGASMVRTKPRHPVNQTQST